MFVSHFEAFEYLFEFFLSVENEAVLEEILEGRVLVLPEGEGSIQPFLERVVMLGKLVELGGDCEGGAFLPHDKIIMLGMLI